MIEQLSAVTLATHDIRRAVRFYRMLGFAITHDGEEERFTGFRAGGNFLNLIAVPTDREWSWWGRDIFYASDVGGLYRPDRPGRPVSESRCKSALCPAL